MTNEASPSEITADTDRLPDTLPMSEGVQFLVTTRPDSIGTLALRADQEPSTEQLAAEGKIQSGGEVVGTPAVYTQPPSTVASVFAAGLAEVMNSGIGPQEQKEKAVHTVFETIKEMVKVFADTMRERKLVPEYAYEHIKIPEEPTGLRRVFGMEQSSPGVRLSPYWPILTGSDLNGRPMEDYQYPHTTWVIGAKPDGELIYLEKSSTDGYISYGENDYSVYRIRDDKVVDPDDLFNVNIVRADPTDSSRQTKVIATLEQKLQEQGVAIKKRTATDYGYEPVVLTYDKRLKQYVK